MYSTILAQIIAKVLELAPPDVAKRVVDDFLDHIEDYVSQSESKVDDALLPAIAWLRRIADIPDDIGGDPD